MDIEPYIFPVVGVALLVTGLYMLIMNNRHKKVWTKTTGKVIGLTEKEDDDGDVLKYPFIEFHDQDNVRTTVHCSMGADPSPCKPGDDITFYYDPQNPQNMLVQNVMFEYMTPVIILLIGSVFSINGFGPLLLPYIK